MKLRATVKAVLLVGLVSAAMGDSPDAGKSKISDTKGLNLKKYHQIVEDIRANPDHGRVEFRAIAEGQEMVYHSAARIGPFKAGGEEMGKTREYVLQLGLPVELQGDVDHPVDRIEPVELALAGLSDCIIGTISLHAVLNSIQIESISATVRAPFDLQVLLGIDDVDKREEMYGKISMSVEIEGPTVTEEHRLFLSEQLKRSPVFNLVGLAHEMDSTIKIRK